MNKTTLNFTPAAIDHIKKAMQQEGGVFHLAVKKAGCSGYKYQPKMLAKASENDEPLQLEQQLTVYIERDSLPLLQGTTVDYVSKGLGQQQMVFLNPNAASECGCGESFFLDDNSKE